MGQLEPQLRAVLRGRLKSLLLERRMTSIFVTHDQTEANALADRIAVMEGGRAAAIRRSDANSRIGPANLFVATFVGEPPMNVFDADAINADRVRFTVANGPALDFAASEIPLWRSQRDRLPRPGRHRRASAFGAARGRRAGRAGRLQPMARRSNPCRARSGRQIARCRLPCAASRRSRESGCATAIAPDALHVFDASSGAALSHGLEAA